MRGVLRFGSYTFGLCGRDDIDGRRPAGRTDGGRCGESSIVGVCDVVLRGFGGGGGGAERTTEPFS